MAATLYLVQERRKGPSPVPPGVPSGWRNNRWRRQEQALQHAGGRLTVAYCAGADDHFKMAVADGQDGGHEVLVRLVEVGAERLVMEVEGVRRRFSFGGEGRRLAVHGGGRVTEWVTVPRLPERKVSAVAGGCAAPMTGRVVQVLVKVGDRVRSGATLVVLEAMKMEHRMQAGSDGVVEAVGVKEGQMVDPDQVLVVVVPDREGDREGDDGNRDP
jgi:propionyl-CoA carboxylase alpha chain